MIFRCVWNKKDTCHKYRLFWCCKWPSSKMFLLCLICSRLTVEWYCLVPRRQYNAGRCGKQCTYPTRPHTPPYNEEGRLGTRQRMIIAFVWPTGFFLNTEGKKRGVCLHCFLFLFYFFRKHKIVEQRNMQFVADFISTLNLALFLSAWRKAILP